jgi:PAS domain S-box-containing protein
MVQERTSELFEANKKLTESERKFKAVADNSPLAIYMAVGIEQKGEYINPTFYKLFGYTLDDVPSLEQWLPLAYPDEIYRQQLYEEWHRRVKIAIETCSDIEPMESVVTCKDGSRKNIQWGFKSIGDQNWSFGLDLTERIQADQLLREREEKYRNLFYKAEIAMFRSKLDGSEVLDCNQKFLDIIGKTREEAIGKPSANLWADLQERYEMDRRVSVDGRVSGYEFKMLDSLGNIKNCITSLVLYREQGILEGSILDITEFKHAQEERLHLEKQLLHTQKLESLGILAGGIAHDFNNILMAIMGNAELALMRINKESPVVDNLNAIEHASARAADLATQMLAYSGKGSFVIENLNLNRLIEDMLQILEVSISKKAVLRLNLSSYLPLVEADATQIRQIVMNLVINASEAIGGRSGFITVTTSSMELNKSYLRKFRKDWDIGEGLYVCLEVSDTGCGMDDETMKKIFDPFFTTKFTGRGLGMAAVQGIVRGHKGAINVDSKPNKGTSFKLLLPASGNLAEVSTNDNHQVNWRGEGKVLLVDDEEIVRSIGIEMLKELGYDVIIANDGKEALEVFKATPDISFVILDLTMPHMDGEQCFHELQKIKPDIKVIISSGFSELEISQKFAGLGLAGVIQKPYKLSVLKESLQGALSTNRRNLSNTL